MGSGSTQSKKATGRWDRDGMSIIFVETVLLEGDSILVLITLHHGVECHSLPKNFGSIKL